jgi:subtilisin family serine protease
MKNHYSSRQGCSRAVCLLLFLMLFFAQFGYGQTHGKVMQGVVRIKVSEALAGQIENARMSRDASNVLQTGIQSIDQVNRQFKTKGIQRVFRDAGKYEAKHRRYGLHLWYEVKMDKASSVLSALVAYKNIPHVKVSEAIYEKAIIGSDNKNYGPVIYNNTLAPQSPLTGASNDPLFGSQWHYNNTGQTNGTLRADINLIKAWGLETGNKNVIVAITDGGVQVNHPDIAANMWVNAGEIAGNNIDDDHNGFVDDINGYGFADNSGNITPDDHGTHVAGTIAAVTNNGLGVAGIAGGSGNGDGVRIMSCAAFGAAGNGNFADTYVYSADNGAVISQNSWGYTTPGVFEQAVLDAIDYFIAEAGTDANGNQVGPMKGGIVLFAAGNSNSNAAHYPGFYSSTFAVSGTNHKDQKGWYSNFGPWVEVAAPGGETNSVTQQGVLSTLKNNQYGFFQGTSMACPHASGVAALIVSKFGGPGLTPAMVKARIMQTADNIDAVNPSFVGMLGAGRINAFSALQENDNVAPTAITDLAAINPKISSVTLHWTAPTDPGNNGAASFYDIRYSTSPITSDNFINAIAINAPSPGLPGVAQESVVTGLASATQYYFAMKSADFFGNTSALSNVATTTTFFSPSFSFAPSIVNIDLKTAEEVSAPLTLYNKGQGPLSFQFVVGSGPTIHATPSQYYGTIASNDSLSMSIQATALLLSEGTYPADLKIITNDPLHETDTIPVALHVTNNGKPIVYVINTPLDFGQVFEPTTKTVPLQIRNNGSDTL